MDKKTLFAFVVLTAALSFTARAAEEAAEAVPAVTAVSADHIDGLDTRIQLGPTIDRKPEVGLQLWFSSGHGEWEIEFGALFLQGRSKLEWEDIDAPVIVVHAEVPVSAKLSIGGLIGYGEISGGQNTDGDWLGDFQFSESKADTDGDVRLADINLYYNIVDDRNEGDALKLDFFAGLQYYKDDLNDTDGVQTIENEVRVNQPFFGLDSKYRFEWKMLRLGSRIEYAIDDHVRFNLSAALLLLIDYKGEAYWNLRSDFRRDDPNFIHEADSGFGLEGKAGIRVKIADNLYVDGGYWLMVMRAEDGIDTIYFADGTQDSTDLSYVETIRQGMYGGIIYEF